MLFGAMVISLLCQGCAVYSHIPALPLTPFEYSLLGIAKTWLLSLAIENNLCNIPVNSLCVLFDFSLRPASSMATVSSLMTSILMLTVSNVDLVLPQRHGLQVVVIIGCYSFSVNTGCNAEVRLYLLLLLRK